MEKFKVLGQTLSRACGSGAKVNGETFIPPAFVCCCSSSLRTQSHQQLPSNNTHRSKPSPSTHSDTSSHTLTQPVSHSQHTHIAIYICILSHTATFVHTQTHHFFPIRSQIPSHFPQEQSLRSISQTSATINLTHWRSPKTSLLPFSADTCFDLLYQSNIAPYRDQKPCVFPGEPNL